MRRGTGARRREERCRWPPTRSAPIGGGAGKVTEGPFRSVLTRAYVWPSGAALTPTFQFCQPSMIFNGLPAALLKRERNSEAAGSRRPRRRNPFPRRITAGDGCPLLSLNPCSVIKLRRYYPASSPSPSTSLRPNQLAPRPSLYPIVD